jgi:hypothetical protein
MITFLHTSEVHVPVFTALLDAVSPETACRHVVREDLLQRARDEGMTASLRKEIAGIVRASGGEGVTVCSCSTIGAVAEDAARNRAVRLVRIDRALMQAALDFGGRPMLVLCLESTREASVALLREVAAARAMTLQPEVVMCEDAWRHFEAGDHAAYARAIDAMVKAALMQMATPPDCIVLGQASMAVAEPMLANTGLPVLTSPRRGVEAAVSMLQGRR